MHVEIYTLLRGQSFERALVLIFTTEVGLGQKLALHILTKLSCNPSYLQCLCTCNDSQQQIYR